MHVCYLDQFLGNDSLETCPYTRWHGNPPPADLLSTVQHTVREPVCVTFDDMKLLEHEPPTASSAAQTASSWEAVLLSDCQPVEKSLQQYYRKFQAFAKDRRHFLSTNGSKTPDDIEKHIKKEWRQLLVSDAEQHRLSV